MRQWSLREQNRGASLIAVLVAIIFVMTIGGIVMSITTTNILMREAEASAKRNFYGAEDIVDEISAGMSNSAAVAMQASYNEILENYRTFLEDGTDMELKFRRSYMDRLIALFCDTTNAGRTGAMETQNGGEVVYQFGYYDVEKIAEMWRTVCAHGNSDPSDFTASGERDFLVTQNDNSATYTVDYEEGVFTLQNVNVVFTNAAGYQTNISTDIVFHTPALSFGSNSSVKNYMKYGLIADDSIIFTGVTNIAVNGSMYAGSNGIVVNHSNAVLKGSDIVTRGNIEIRPGSIVTIGDGSGRIWAEDILTTGSGDPSTITLDGNIYVADDLTLNGVPVNNPTDGSNRYNTVTLKGNYYGYNFREIYDTSTAVNNSDFSSAIVINGENSRLNMEGLNYLLLAGRTFISRGGSANNDIYLGESLSVRTNQLAYNVPASYVNEGVSPVRFIAEPGVDGIALYATSIGLTKAQVENRLNPAEPIAVYRYADGGIVRSRYYLNFKDEQSANDFFADFWTSNSTKTGAYASNYADAIKLDLGNMVYTLKGDVMYRNGTNFGVEKLTIDGSLWDPSGAYFDYADRLAVNYMALQMYLEDSHAGIDSSNIRFYSGNGFTRTIDKTVDPLVYNLIDMDRIKDDDVDKANVTVHAMSDGAAVIVEDTDAMLLTVGSGSATGIDKGIVIVTGNVQVQGSFTGVIISGGTIAFNINNASVTADEILVRRMFEEDLASDNSLFTQYFYDYDQPAERILGSAQVNKYMTYENWSRTEN